MWCKWKFNCVFFIDSRNLWAKIKVVGMSNWFTWFYFFFFLTELRVRRKGNPYSLFPTWLQNADRLFNDSWQWRLKPQSDFADRAATVTLESSGRREHGGNALVPYWSQSHYYQLRWTGRLQSRWLCLVCPTLCQWGGQISEWVKDLFANYFFPVCRVQWKISRTQNWRKRRGGQRQLFFCL